MPIGARLPAVALWPGALAPSAAAPARPRGVARRSLDLVLRGLRGVLAYLAALALVLLFTYALSWIEAIGWSVVGSIAWSLGLIAVFGPLAGRRYRRAS